MGVRINLEKYDYKKYNPYTVDESGEVVSLSQKKKEKIERDNKEKEVCLNCTKKNCSGYRSCFERERNKIK